MVNCCLKAFSGLYGLKLKQRVNMYAIINKSTGIVVIRYNDRQFALDWLSDNNNLNGEPVELYLLVKVKDLKNDGV